MTPSKRDQAAVIMVLTFTVAQGGQHFSTDVILTPDIYMAHCCVDSVGKERHPEIPRKNVRVPNIEAIPKCNNIGTFIIAFMIMLAIIINHMLSLAQKH